MLAAEQQALELWGLFSSAFISSTIAPGGSEGVLVWLAARSSISAPTLIGIATLGNTLGAVTTLLLGSFAQKGVARRGLEKRSETAIARVKRWGMPVLLFSWLPLVGDALCFAAGWLHLPLIGSSAVILIGKLFRYTALVYFFA
ncbi:MAG: YqaA family protein [Gammaproteobacteria bacterium]